jgi:hypothetical protein
MSSDRRATADDEGEDRTAALSNFLMDTLRPPRPPVAEPPPAEAAIAEAAEIEPAAAATAEEAIPPPPVEDPPAVAEAAAEPETAEAEGPVDDPEAAAVASTEAALASEAFEDEASVDEESEARSAASVPLVPPIEGSDAGANIDEPDPSLVFLAQERRARRTQRIVAGLAIVALLLFAGGFLWLKRGAPEPVAEAAEPPSAAAAQSPAPAKPADPVNAANDEAAEPEAIEEGTTPVMKSGLSAAFKAPAVDPSAAPVPGGPSTARYPDLPRDVLIQLENAASTAEKQP